jgi:hypothetical protein
MRLIHLSQHNHLIAFFSRPAILSFCSARICGTTFPDARLQDKDEKEGGDGYGGVDEDYRASLASEMEA